MRRVSLFALLALAGVLLSASRCYESDDHDLTPRLIDETLALSVAGNSTSIPADGASRLRLIAEISRNADGNRRTIGFSTSAGTIVGGTPTTGGPSGEQSVIADSTGRATIELQSPQQVGSAVVTVRVIEVPGLTRTLAVGFTAPNADDLVRFVSAPTSAPADGATLNRFDVVIAPTFALGTPVTFSVAGDARWSPGGGPTISVPTDGSFRATALLQSPTTLGRTLVRATANNITREVPLDFVRALPDVVLVSTAQKVEVKPGFNDPVSVTATLSRNVGTVTQGTVVVWTATDRNGQSIGLFRDATTTGANQQASATFLVGDTTYRGNVTIAASAQGHSVRGTAVVVVVDP